MKRTYLQIGILTLAIGVAGPLIWSSPAYSETAGMERRDDRRDDRQGAQDIRQEGRDVARDAKDACKDAGGSGPECRQEKREIKQDARKAGRELKKNDWSDIAVVGSSNGDFGDLSLRPRIAGSLQIN